MHLRWSEVSKCNADVVHLVRFCEMRMRGDVNLASCQARTQEARCQQSSLQRLPTPRITRRTCYSCDCTHANTDQDKSCVHSFVNIEKLHI